MTKQDRALHLSIENGKEEALALLQDLVRIPSITGSETKVQERVAEELKRMELETDVWCPTRKDLEDHPAFSDDGLPLGHRPVVVGRWKGSDPKAPSLTLNGHVDVVPVGDEKAWNDGPWSGIVRDNKLWGRGSCDMKGGLVSGIAAIAALQKCGIQPRGDVYVQSVIGEETGGAGTLATLVRGYRSSAAIILEPTSLDLAPVGAGAASFRLHVNGLAAHGAMREKGVSSIEKYFPLHRAMEKMEKKRHEEFRHPLYAEGVLVAPISVGRLSAGDWPSTVPELLTAEGRYGIFPGESMKEARAQFEMTIQSAARSDSWLRKNPPRVEWFEGQFEPAATPLDARILEALGAAHEGVCGKRPVMRGVPYGSDLRFFTNHAAMHAVLYGPGDVAHAHAVNEFVPLDEVFRAAEVVARVILNW